MSEKQGVKIDTDKKHLPQWARNIIGGAAFLACSAGGVAIGLELSDFSNNDTVMDTVEDIGNIVLPTGVGVTLGGAIGISFLGGIDNGPSSPSENRRTPQ